MSTAYLFGPVCRAQKAPLSNIKIYGAASLERAELIVTVGVEKLGPHGERPTIVVEPSGLAYREKVPTKRKAAA